MNRKEFVKKASIGMAGLSIAGYTPAENLTKIVHENGIQYRTLGRTGLKVSAVGFGATRTEEPSIMKRVIDTGVNFFDTGRTYSGGRNEETIGKVIRGGRDKIIIQSKFSRRSADEASILKSIEESLKALATDYIDIMLIHGPTKTEEISEQFIFDALGKAKDSGKIRFTGFSCHNNQAELLRYAIGSGWYDVVMIAYNHAGNYTHSVSGNFYKWDQAELEKTMGDVADAGIGLVAMKTCSGGPFASEGQSEATYAEALRKTLTNRYIASVVPGMGNFKEIEEDTKAMFES